MISCKNIFILLAALFASGMNAQAGIPRASVTKMALAVHGIYVSADPLCKSGFSATVPLSATASVVDFTQSPSLGEGTLPTSVGCILILFEDALSISWAAGNYTSTTSGASDNLCNAGGSLTQKICRGTAISFPAQVVADAAAVGLTLGGTCPVTPTGTEIVPLYLSTYSACAGKAGESTACTNANSGDGANAFAAPTISGDANNGIKLVAPAVGGSAYVFVTDPDQVAVGVDGGHCGSIGPPLFSFRAR